MTRNSYFRLPAALAVVLAALFLVPRTHTAPSASSLIITVAGTGQTDYTGDGGPALYSAVSGPRGLSFGPSSSLYVAAYNENRIRRIDSAGVISTPFLGYPYDVVVDGAGNLLVANPQKSASSPALQGFTVAHSIIRVAPDGTITGVAGNGTAGFSGDNGPATAAQLNFPASVAVDAAGNIYIADRNNHRIRKVTTGGVISTFAGNGTAGFSGDNGAATSASLNSPQGLGFDAAGNLYIADTNNHRIRRVTPGGTISTFAGNGSAAFAGDTGPGTSASLSAPSDIAIDSQGVAFIADAGNHRVRMVSAGTITTVAGSGATGVAGETAIGDGGLATAAILDPSGIGVDASGSVYVSDGQLHNRVRKLVEPPANNPVPSIQFATPLAVAAGQASFNLSVYGSGFVPGATVTWNGTARPTTYVGSGRLVASINAADVGAAGSAQVRVSNPTTGGGGGASDPLSFTIHPAPPVLGSERLPIAGALPYTGDGRSGSGAAVDEGFGMYVTLEASGGMAFDGAGNLYVSGGQKRISPSRVVTKVVSSVPLASGGDVVVDASGNLYTSQGHRVLKVTPGGVATAYAGTGVPGFSGDGALATAAQLLGPRGLALDSAGNLFIAEAGHVRRVGTDGIITTVAGNGIYSPATVVDGAPALRTPLYLNNIAVDAAGNICGGNIRISTTGIVTVGTYLGNGNLGFDSAGRLYVNSIKADDDPRVMACGGASPETWDLVQNGYAYEDSGNRGRVVRVQPPTVVHPIPAVVALVPKGKLAYNGATDEQGNPVGGFMLSVHGAGFTLGSTVLWDGSPVATTYADATELRAAIPAANLTWPGAYPVSVANPTTGGGGGISNSLNFLVAQPPAPVDATINTVAGSTAGFSGDGGPASSAQFFSPAGLAFDAAGNLYVADQNNSRVRRITPGGIISTYAGGGQVLGDGGPATSARLGKPVSLAVDGAGNLYIADREDHRVRKVTPAGIISTVAGTGTAGYTGDGGPAAAAQLNTPYGVTVDGAGNVYITHTTIPGRVRRVSAVDGSISTIAGYAGTFTGSGAPALFTRLTRPLSLAVDLSGALLIADYDSYLVRRLLPDGNLVVVAGRGAPDTSDAAGIYLSEGKPALDAYITRPSALAVDQAGNFYFIDGDSHAVRRVDSAGILTTVAGMGQAGFAGDGGSATAARLYNASGIALGPNGYLYIADTGNHRIRVVTGLAGPACMYSLSALVVTHPATAGTGSVTVTTGDACPWAAASNASWITITSGSSGTGAGTVGYSFSANTGTMTRTGTITIAGYTYTIRQSPSITCEYSLSSTSATHPGQAASYSVNVTAPEGCAWSATSNANWITITSGSPGSGNGSLNYSLTANDTSNPRTGSLTIAGHTYTVTQDALNNVQGNVTAGNSSAAPGGTASIPITFTLTSEVNADSLSFGVVVTPVSGAPALQGVIQFTAAASMPAPSFVDAPSPGAISVYWSTLSPSLTGTLVVGSLSVSVPAGAQVGQTYAVAVTGASSSQSASALRIAPGPDAVLLVSHTYLVGDAAPAPSAAGDLNNDGVFNTAGEFGNDTLDNLDLIAALRSVTNLPGYRPPECSDRFDAMDSAPADTDSTRGGDAFLDNLDLIMTLRRVTNTIPSRPRRAPRGTACIAGVVEGVEKPGRGSAWRVAAASLSVGEPVVQPGGGYRFPVYLTASADPVLLAALSLGFGVEGEREAVLRFIPASDRPSLADDGLPGHLAVAWLDGFAVKAGESVLLGFVEIEQAAGRRATPALRVYGASANARADGRRLVIAVPDPQREAR